MSASIEKASASKYTLEQWLGSNKWKTTIENIVGNPTNAARFVQICETATRRQPELLKCSQSSVLGCLMRLAQVNLDPDGYHAHLIPYWNNKAKDDEGKIKPQLEAQLIVDYKGMIRAIRRDPNVSVMKGGVIYQKDGWRHEEGTGRVFRHQPSYLPPGNDNPIVGAYSFIQWKDGDWDVDILPVWKIELTRARSRAADSGPWKSDYDEMCVKTAIRHHSKRLPLRSEDRDIIQLDDDQFEHHDPFSGKLTITKPEFKNERSLPSVDQSDGAQADAGASDTIRDTGRTQEPGKRGNKRREKEVPAPAHTGEYGPGADFGPEATGDNKPPDEGDRRMEPRASSRDISKGDGRVQTMVRSEPHDDDQKNHSKAEQLLAKINKEGVAQTDVIAVLGEHEMDLGQAKESGLVSDLPAETIDKAVQHWGSIIFNLKK